jgi:hypothetical protein
MLALNKKKFTRGATFEHAQQTSSGQKKKKTLTERSVRVILKTRNKSQQNYFYKEGISIGHKSILKKEPKGVGPKGISSRKIESFGQYEKFKRQFLPIDQNKSLQEKVKKLKQIKIDFQLNKKKLNSLVKRSKTVHNQYDEKRKNSSKTYKKNEDDEKENLNIENNIDTNTNRKNSSNKENKKRKARGYIRSDFTNYNLKISSSKKEKKIYKNMPYPFGEKFNSLKQNEGKNLEFKGAKNRNQSTSNAEYYSARYEEKKNEIFPLNNFFIGSKKQDSSSNYQATPKDKSFNQFHIGRQFLTDDQKVKQPEINFKDDMDMKQFNMIKTVERKRNVQIKKIEKNKEILNQKTPPRSDQSKVSLKNESLKTEEKIERNYFQNPMNCSEDLTDLDLGIRLLSPDSKQSQTDTLTIDIKSNEKIELKNNILDRFAQIQTKEKKKRRNPFQELINTEKKEKTDLRLIRRRQKEIKWRMRAILFDWMNEVCSDNQFCREAYHYSLCYVDQYLANGNTVDKSNFQLLGLTCLFIACKMEEVDQISAEDLVSYTMGAYGVQDLLNLELEVVKVNIQLTLDAKMETKTCYVKSLAQSIDQHLGGLC